MFGVQRLASRIRIKMMEHHSQQDKTNILRTSFRIQLLEIWTLELPHSTEALPCLKESYVRVAVCSATLETALQNNQGMLEPKHPATPHPPGEKMAL